MGLFADDHPPARRRRLQPRRGIDDVPGRQRLARARAPTVTTASPVLTAARAASSSRAPRSAPRSLEHAEPGAHRALRVVPVRDRRAEHRHDRVADELLDRAAVLLDPPLRLAWYSCSQSRTSSGSAPSARAVNPTRSTNRIETSFRSSSAARTVELGAAAAAETRTVGVVGAAARARRGCFRRRHSCPSSCSASHAFATRFCARVSHASTTSSRSSSRSIRSRAGIRVSTAG